VSEPFKYVPSAVTLSHILPTLLAARSALTEHLRGLYEEQKELNRPSFGVSDDEADDRRRRELDSKFVKLWGQQDVVNNLLAPYEEEYRQQLEAYNCRKCAEMMRI